MARRKVIFEDSPYQPQPADPQLMQAFDFTEYELYFNQQGDLSEKQYYRLYYKRRLMTLMILGIACVPLTIWFSLGRDLTPDTQAKFLGFMLLFFCLPIMMIAWMVWQRYTHDLYVEPVTYMTGQIQLDIQRLDAGRTGIVYGMTIGDKVFRLKKHQLLTLHHQAWYTVYYTPTTEQILSIEPE